MIIVQRKRIISEKIEIKDGIIPYDEIKDEKEITFVVVTEDTQALEKTISAITKVYKENKDKSFNVVITRSYEKIKEFI